MSPPNTQQRAKRERDVNLESGDDETSSYPSPLKKTNMAKSSRKMQLNFFEAACVGSHTAIGQWK